MKHWDRYILIAVLLIVTLGIINRCVAVTQPKPITPVFVSFDADRSPTLAGAAYSNCRLSPYP